MEKKIIYERSFGQSGLHFSPLGIGTIWFGRKWPPNNHDYVKPDSEEIEKYMMTCLSSLSTKSNELVMIDTATGYGYTEEKLGQFYNRYPHLAEKSFIATKFGHERHGGPPVHSISVETLHKDIKKSAAYLPKIDLIYSHVTSSIPEEEALSFLRDNDVKKALLKYKEEHYGGLQYIGSSISNINVLTTAFAEGLLEYLDVIQLPAWMVHEKPDIISQLYSSGLAVVVNSPVRHLVGKKSFANCYTEIWDNKHISMILTGTRRHLSETLGYFKICLADSEKKNPQHDLATEPLTKKAKIHT